MNGNPYSEILGVFRDQVKGEAQTLRLRQGVVKHTRPLSVSVAGATLPASSFRVNADSLLSAGDTVLLLTEDDQIFYILMKVVNAV